MTDSAAVSRTPRFHRAWIVVAVTLGALVAGSAFRSSTGVLMIPLEVEFGWSRTVTSGAVTANLVLYGLTAPFAAALMERWGVRRVVCLALALVGVASALTTIMTSAWQLWLLWGICIGTGTGAMALVFGAIVANRWFESHRGLVTGIFSAANAAGQLVFLPAIARTVEESGWRWAALIVGALALVLVPLVWLFVHDHPHEVGWRPYGATTDVPAPPPVRSTDNPARAAMSVLGEVWRTWPFQALAFTFFVCGWSTNGIIQTHFVPAAHDHGMPATTAAGLLAVIGVFDVVGTVASGWLTDRVDSRYLLGAYYAGRGLSLLVLPGLLGPDVQPALWIFIVFYGLDWVATVPPTMALCREHFGVERSSIVFGWVFASHMIGAGLGASFAGAIRVGYGAYALAWLAAGALCVVAAVASVAIPRRREQDRVALST